ncbi:hypothetical protein BDN67DRAFT_1015870 [Paxillus ammoniavirescens]|nr:hypothetical protein BDN67DRAFT_1015870 [Paxillus ammoniavirescens]
MPPGTTSHQPKSSQTLQRFMKSLYLSTYILFDHFPCIYCLLLGNSPRIQSLEPFSYPLAVNLEDSCSSTTTHPTSNHFTSLPGFDLKAPSRITYPFFSSFFAFTRLITKNLSRSAREKEEICLSASVLTASLKGQTVHTLPPSTGLVLIPS